MEKACSRFWGPDGGSRQEERGLDLINMLCDSCASKKEELNPFSLFLILKKRSFLKAALESGL